VSLNSSLLDFDVQSKESVWHGHGQRPMLYHIHGPGVANMLCYARRGTDALALTKQESSIMILCPTIELYYMGVNNSEQLMGKFSGHYTLDPQIY
jgi:hypothetical protein